MGVMKLTKARDWEDRLHPFLINGFLSGSRTLLSGEAKVGKSMLAGHLVSSLIHQSPFLGITPQEGFHKVAWMGFDASWQAEYRAKFPFEIDHVYFADSIEFNQESEWNHLGELLIEGGFTLFVVDHLYGMAGSLELDKSFEMTRAIAPILKLQSKTQIPLLLIAHAPKTGTGRAAHSTYLEAQFRHLLRLTGSARGTRREILSMGNLVPSAKYLVNLDLRELSLIGTSQDGTQARSRERTEIALTQARRFLLEAPEWARKNFSQAGRWFASVGMSRTEEAGRSLAKKLRDQDLISDPTDNCPFITRGSKLPE
jgi:hypothetical protein